MTGDQVAQAIADYLIPHSSHHTERFLPQVERTPYVPGELDGEVIAQVERKRQELLAKGYRPALVQKGLDWAVNTALGTGTFWARFASEAEQPMIRRRALFFFLDKVEEWVRPLST